MHTVIESYVLKLRPTYGVFKITQTRGATYQKTVTVIHSGEEGLTPAPVAA